MVCDYQNDGLLHTTCGSPNYIAPEVKDGLNSHSKKKRYDGLNVF